MILTFQELGLECYDFQGRSYAQAYPEIIDIACNHLMLYYFYNMAENDCIKSFGFVNFILQTVEIETVIPMLH